MKARFESRWGGLWGGAAALFLGGGSLQAQIVIEVGVHTLLPQTAGQAVEFFVSNRSTSLDYQFQSLELNVQVGDGGAAAGGTSVGPRITGADLVTATLFTGNNVGTQDASGSPQAQHPLLGFFSTLTLSGTVVLPAGESRSIGTVFFDTTGVVPSDWSLALGSTINGSTKFVNLALLGDDGHGNFFPQITEGSLRIVAAAVPEPEFVGAVGCVLVGWACWRRSARKASA